MAPQKSNHYQPGPEFRKIIDATPLASVDLLIRDNNNAILLGKRVNRPAMGFWFVPGGRIKKNETIAEAIRRVSQTELGVVLTKQEGSLVGAYDHIYDDNYWGDSEVNTHYVALAFEFRATSSIHFDGDTQHSSLEWWQIPDMLASNAVHQNTKNYFT